MASALCLPCSASPGNLSGGINPDGVQYYNCTNTGSNGAHPGVLLFPALITALVAVATSLLLGL